jgi:hypothetical protein
VPYAAMYRNDRPFAFMALVATLAPSVCDFTDLSRVEITGPAVMLGCA